MSHSGKGLVLPYISPYIWLVAGLMIALFLPIFCIIFERSVAQKGAPSGAKFLTLQGPGDDVKGGHLKNE